MSDQNLIDPYDYDGWIHSITLRIHEMEQANATDAAGRLRQWLEDAKLARMMKRPIIQPIDGDVPF